MSNQVQHSLIQAVIMMAIAALGTLVESQTSILSNLGVDPIFWPIAGAVLAATVRWFEGLRDGQRAEKGIVVPSDVAYDRLKEESEDPFNTSVFSIPGTESVRVI